MRRGGVTRAAARPRGGFDLHAAVYVATADRARLNQLCRYLCRLPLGQERLRVLRDGRVAPALQRPWADGTTHLAFTQSELLARLVPLIPRPRVNLLLYHWVLSPNAPWCAAVVPLRGDVQVTPAVGGPRERLRRREWRTELMRRAFEADVLACRRCGGRMVVTKLADAIVRSNHRMLERISTA